MLKIEIKSCNELSCELALYPQCVCHCEGANHGKERWRNFYLIGTPMETLTTRPLEVFWKTPNPPPNE